MIIFIIIIFTSSQPQLGGGKTRMENIKHNSDNEFIQGLWDHCTRSVRENKVKLKA